MASPVQDNFVLTLRATKPRLGLLLAFDGCESRYGGRLHLRQQPIIAHGSMEKLVQLVGGKVHLPHSPIVVPDQGKGH